MSPPIRDTVDDHPPAACRSQQLRCPLPSLTHNPALPQTTGNTPLHAAVAHLRRAPGPESELRQRCLKALLAAASAGRGLGGGSSVLNLKNLESQTPLHLAAWVLAPAAIRLLAAAGADTEGRDKARSAAIVAAANKQHNLSAAPIPAWDQSRRLVPTLVLTVSSQDDRTPLHLAVTARNPECLKALCDAGANLNALNAVSADRLCGLPSALPAFLTPGSPPRSDCARRAVASSGLQACTGSCCQSSPI